MSGRRLLSLFEHADAYSCDSIVPLPVVGSDKRFVGPDHGSRANSYRVMIEVEPKIMDVEVPEHNSTKLQKKFERLYRPRFRF